MNGGGIAKPRFSPKANGDEDGEGLGKVAVVNKVGAMATKGKTTEDKGYRRYREMK
jgi:hypothetical protein